MKGLKRIICIGNIYLAEDSAGPLVYANLKQRSISNDIELIDGGLAGLNLLCYLEGEGQVVFVDSINGFTQSGEVVVLEKEAILTQTSSTFDHNAGLGYLLQVLPQVTEGGIPKMQLVGIEGIPGPNTVNQAADICISLFQ